ncbi:MAG: DUF3606 domain-containing protein [Betaproteobacteria bacterium]|nr:MAG: DUF3606 domain-containing protein [Betaproteobacteria bacterium]
MAYASLTVMKSFKAETKRKPANGDGAPVDVERECETWDWARTAGVSEADLRKAVRESLEPKDRSGERRS